MSVGAVGTAGPVRSRLPLPQGVDLWAFGAVALGYLLLFVPVWRELAGTTWATDEQGHGPIVLAVGLWLLYRDRNVIAEAASKPAHWLGWPLLLLSLVLYALGRSQDIIMFAVGAQIGTLAALMLIFGGGSMLRKGLFPLFFMLFMVPLPEVLVATVTAPLKTAVSAVASWLLFHIGYPVGRVGVIMTVGQYQLLVADACAGLNSMFTLEALGLLYMNLMKYTRVARNVALAILLVPIAFCANVTRVIILVLVTYHFGDEAGQGFVHGFAGLVLFMVALFLMLVVDKMLSWVWPERSQAAK